MRRTELGSGERYRPTESLGGDALGTLWRGTDTLSGAPVIVRLLDERLLSDPGAVHQGTNALERIRGHTGNPHLARVLHHNLRRPGERPAFVVSEGSAVETLVRRLERGGLSARVALHVIAAVADGLAFAHEAWVYHGALTAASVVVDREAVVKVVDVGLGDLLDARAEQRGAGAVHISDRGAADVLALASLFEQMLSGAPPWQASSEAGTSPIGRDGVPTDVDALMRRARSPHRLQRPRMAELAEALSPALDSIPEGEAAAFGVARSDLAAGPGSTPVMLPAGPHRSLPSRPAPPRPDPLAAATAERAETAAQAPDAASAVPAKTRPKPGAPRRRPRRRRLVLVALTGVVVAIGAVGGVYALRAFDADGDAPASPSASATPSSAASPTPSVTPSVGAQILQPATVPAVLGVPVEQATELVERAGLMVGSITTVPGRSGIVIASEPTQGEAVAAGTVVDLFVGNGAGA